MSLLFQAFALPQSIKKGQRLQGREALDRVAGNEPPVAMAPDVYPVQGCPVKMDAGDSYGYPRWLALLVSGR